METKQKKQTNDSNGLIILKHDYDMLINYVRTKEIELKYDRIMAGQLIEKIGQADKLNKNDFPQDVIRLNSRVKLRDTIARLNYEYTLVIPDDVDHRNDKVSILAPIGYALFGYRKGDTVTLQSSIGKKHYLIQEVVNPVD